MTSSPSSEERGRKRKLEDITGLVSATTDDDAVIIDEKGEDEKKEKTTCLGTADAYARIAAAAKNINGTTTNTASTTNANTTTSSGIGNSGRGSVAGWTYCPLCFPFSRKLFARGRGVASHLHDVHTPWKAPSKAELKRRKKRKQQQQLAAERRKKNEKINEEKGGKGDGKVIKRKKLDHDIHEEKEKDGPTSWEPSTQEMEDWNSKVIDIVQDLDEKPLLPDDNDKHSNKNNKTSSSPGMMCSNNKEEQHHHQKQDGSSGAILGVDRNGERSQNYRSSLPPFLRAAADGDLLQLQQMIHEKQQQKKDDDDDDDGGNKAILEELLNRTDRHLSIAEHWAAGGGHLDCLKLLVETRKRIEKELEDEESTGTAAAAAAATKTKKKKLRRRDGKTALHYAARNGRISCIDYLLGFDDDDHDEKEQQQQGQQRRRRRRRHEVDEISGDGTTPFQLACYGGHYETMEVLINKYGADPLKCNDWGCTSAHWVGMTKCTSTGDVRKMCRLLAERGVSFVHAQKQGHTALHKACQRLNRHVIEWLAQTNNTEEGGAGLSSIELEKVGQPDEGGHKPSDIWTSVGGDPKFGEWMKIEMGW